MHSLTVIRKALAEALRTVGDLDVYHYSPNSVSVPCAYIAELEIDPHASFGQDDDLTFTIRVLTSTADDEGGQDLLDEYLSREGPRSVRAALEAARGAAGECALGGVVDDVTVQRVSAYRHYSEGAGTYFGAEITVRVIGNGEA